MFNPQPTCNHITLFERDWKSVSACTTLLSFHVVQKKNTGSELKKCLCMHNIAKFPHSAGEKRGRWAEKMSVHAQWCCFHAMQDKNICEYLVSDENFSEILPSGNRALGQVTWAKMAKNLLHLWWHLQITKNQKNCFSLQTKRTRFLRKAPIFVATSHYTRLTTLLLAANRKGSWNKARISYKHCACLWTIWI